MKCDEEARTMLDRKAAMGRMMEEVQNKLSKTGDSIAHLRWSNFSHVKISKNFFKKMIIFSSIIIKFHPIIP